MRKYDDNNFAGFGKSSGEFAIRYYAKNLQQRGINANTIVPGVVNTDAWNGYLKTLGPKLGKVDLFNSICWKITTQQQIIF